MKNISMCPLLKILTRVLSVNIQFNYLANIDSNDTALMCKMNCYNNIVC